MRDTEKLKNNFYSHIFLVIKAQKQNNLSA